MTNFQGLYDIRSFKPEDANFIYATFLRGLYYGNSWFRVIPKDIFMLNYKKVVGILMYSPMNEVKVACLKDDPDTIIGYSICSKDAQTIHWVHVKGSKAQDEVSWREHGVARSLLPVKPKRISHLTQIGLELMHKYPEAVFNPFL